MKHFILSAAMATALLTLPAYAADEGSSAHKFYVSGNGGVSFLSDADNQGGLLSIKSDYNTGYMFSGALGVHLNDNLRLEGELSYRDNNADSLKITNFPLVPALNGTTANASGDVTALSFMGNVFYDFTQTGSSFVPYLMGGLGVARVDADISVGGIKLVNDSDNVFAYQLGAGMGYQVTDNTAIDVGYRFFDTADSSLKDTAGNSFNSEYQNHTVMLGLRYTF